MRVALLSTAAVAVPPPGYGGTELVLHVLSEGLLDAGHEVTVFATGDSQTEADLRALYDRPVWPIDPLHELNHAAWSCWEMIRDGAFDVVHANHPFVLPLTRFIEAPCVYTLHHDRQDSLSAFYRLFPDIHYVAISERQREREDRLPHVHTVRHGLDADAWSLVPTPGDYVAFLGRFAPTKAPHLAIDAARRAGVRIRLAGRPHPGEGDEYFAREMAHRLPQAGVDWVGEVGGDLKRQFLGEARATLFPICWEEPFGLVMVESMFRGTPVISFARGSAPEVIEDGLTGFLVRDVDEMAQAIARAATIDRTRCRARAVERFGGARMAREYLAVYRAAVAEWRQRHARRPAASAGTSAATAER